MLVLKGLDLRLHEQTGAPGSTVEVLENCEISDLPCRSFIRRGE
jgi:hypothetical protein